MTHPTAHLASQARGEVCCTSALASSTGETACSAQSKIRELQSTLGRRATVGTLGCVKTPKRSEPKTSQTPSPSTYKKSTKSGKEIRNLQIWSYLNLPEVSGSQSGRVCGGYRRGQQEASERWSPSFVSNFYNQLVPILSVLERYFYCHSILFWPWLLKELSYQNAYMLELFLFLFCSYSLAAPNKIPSW